MSKVVRFLKISSLTSVMGLLGIGTAYAAVSVDTFVIWTNHGRDAIECSRKGCKLVLNARTDGEVARASLRLPPLIIP